MTDSPARPTRSSTAAPRDHVDRPAPGPNQAADRAAHAPRRRLLVIDDEAILRSCLRGVFEGEAYAVTTAANGLEALAHIRSHGVPDVILLDLEMPGMNGWQFCDAARRDPALAAVPVVVISAALGEGPDGPPVVRRLYKPVDLDELIALVARLGARERSAAAGG